MTILVNGQSINVEVSPSTTLAEVLSCDLSFSDVRIGCAEGACGSCMILIDKVPRTSCTMLALQLEGRCVTTFDGLEDSAASRVRRWLLAPEASQCGFCVAGIAVSLYALLATDAGCSIEEIDDRLEAHLCRCTGYESLRDAMVSAWSDEADARVLK